MKKTIEKESIKRPGDEDSDSSSSESEERTTIKHVTTKVTQKNVITTRVRKADPSIATSGMGVFDIIESVAALPFLELEVF